MSPATVSLVLRGVAGPSVTTRERVLEAAAQLGYRPDRAASLLASRRSRLIGVVMDIANPFHAQLVEDVQEAAEHQGYDVVLSAVTRGHDERRAIETLLDSRCEALVLLGPQAPAEQLAVLDRQLPVVAVGRPVPSAEVDVVRAADDEGVALAVDHLAGLGHRHITYVDGGRGVMASLRRRGYQRAMRAHGLGDLIQVIRGGNTEESGVAAAHALLGVAPRPTAVLTFNDRAAMGLLDALVRAGVDVPGAMSGGRLRRQPVLAARAHRAHHGQPEHPGADRARRRGRDRAARRRPDRAPGGRRPPAAGGAGNDRAPTRPTGLSLGRLPAGTSVHARRGLCSNSHMVVQFRSIE